MKKLQKKEMKAVKGGNTYCRTACLNRYNRCLSQGGDPAFCEEEYEICITCRCQSVRLC